ncbi:MAG: helix-turn-helix domain-containing protein [bacterium]
MTFSERMTEARRALGVSQRQAAQALGISQAQLSHYENGQREPRLELIPALCRYYGVSADYLLGVTDTADAAEELTRLRRRESDLEAIIALVRRVSE